MMQIVASRRHHVVEVLVKVLVMARATTSRLHGPFEARHHVVEVLVVLWDSVLGTRPKETPQCTGS